MLWIITCFTKPNVDALRAQVHEAHVDYTDAKVKENVLIFSGPQLAEDGKTVIGTIFLIKVNDSEEAHAFSRNEPFTKAGMFASVTLTRMTIRRGRWNPGAIEGALKD
jgi:uncharacterized protein YciI